jgi:protein involved in polysaccharide export with SLBB domain
MFTRANKVLDSQAVARQANHRPTELSAMKLRILHTAVLLIVPTILTAQTPTRDRKSTPAEQPAQSESNSTRDRVVGPKVSNHSSGQSPQANAKTDAGAPAQNQGQPTWGNTAFIVRPSSVERTSASKTEAVSQPVEVASQPQTAKKLVQPTSLLSSPVKSDNANSRTATAARPPVAPSTYNVGIGDVLDVRLSNTSTRESTLFTVMKNGTLEYPLLNGPVSVAGLSTDEISRLLSSSIKVIKAARVTVTVRDYASHAVVIGGLVDSPGRKVLRREAMPLFAVLAEGLVRPEATTATILRNGKEGDPLSLKDDQAMATLVTPGDIIKISGGPIAARKFFYVGGEVGAPGEKAFREGMTLTQALLTAGGAAPSGKIIRVARRNANGFLSTNEYNLRSIEDGKTPDPLLEAGDRIEVTRGS